MRSKQNRAPLFEAVQKYLAEDIIPFHVPGHKQGRGVPELVACLGPQAMAMDLTCLPGLDNIFNPHEALAEAQELAAEAYGADYAYFLVNGTTSGIQAMIMAVCQPGDKIIIPRNAHKSALGGLIMSGARPVYLRPEVNPDFGISTGIRPEQVEEALQEHPDAKAVFVVYPNYYGTAADLPGIVAVAHHYGVPVLVDEAHGAHFAFHPELPPSAMQVGADMAAVSTHKLLGSLTQSSMLLLREGRLDHRHVKAVLNLAQTTSPSYLLLCSLDLARKQAATCGREIFSRVLDLAEKCREELRQIRGLKVLGREVVGRPGCWALDPSKIVVNVTSLGLSGYEAEALLRQRYRVQVELSDLYNLLFLITLGDTPETVGALVAALRDLAEGRVRRKVRKFTPPLPSLPPVAALPREAFYSETRVVPLEEAAGEISAEAITAYPPGIPLVCPGELITQEIVDYVHVLRREKAELQGLQDPEFKTIRVLKKVAYLEGHVRAAQVY
ncbi:MAG: aminotransferase class I/II-fold pyridoxal phosphate-dependent enzyme [Moorellales bacterium]